LNSEKTFIALFAVLSVALLISGCTSPEVPGGNIQLKEPQRFASYNEMVKAFSESRNSGRSYGMDVMIKGGVPMMSQSASETADSGRGSTDYSTTNIQVEGVDEADIVKSDGRYIYNFSKNRLVITDAYPIDDSEIVSKTELKGIYPTEMFVEGDKLLLFGNYSREEVYFQGAMPYRPYYYGGNTIVQLYDVSDKADPKLEKEIEFDGRYLTSRLIGKNAYFVINSWPDYYPIMSEEGELIPQEENIIPRMVEDGVEKRIAVATDVLYIPPMPAESFVTIAALNLDSEELEKETVAGSAESVFASQENIYISGRAWLAPETPVLKEVERIIVGDVEKTIINKFALDKGEIKFVGQGNVPGHILNQFSMDEYNGNFRIATTLGEVWRGPEIGEQSKNNLYVLDEEMNTIGKLEDLAPGEKIYSARFMGAKAYMVTFKKVDPLFVIDVSDPTNPRVLGKLKIPGYSDYLHPIDETHIIGIGKDTIESGYGDFAWYQGMKMAIFDVSDVANPKEMHKIVIGDRGTDSYALHGHKAFLYDKEKQLLVLPITLAEIPEEQKKPLEDNMNSPSYGEPVFQGAFVYKVTLENGFEEKGRITHISEEEELKRGYYYGDEYSVKRSLYMENVLYTLSDKILKANDLTTLEHLKDFVFN